MMEFIQKYARVEGSDVGNGDDMEDASEVGTYLMIILLMIRKRRLGTRMI